MKSSFLADFKKFAMRGNVIDMAVGVIIGGAFGKIVSSVVADIIMPPLGLLIGGVNFTDLKWVMKGPEVVDGVEQAAVTLNYGNFLQATFDFLIIAFSIFLFIRLLTKLTEKKKEEQTGSCSCSCPGSFRRGEIVVGNSGLVKEKRRMRRSSFSAKNNNAAFLSEAALLLMTGFINYPMIYLLLGR